MAESKIKKPTQFGGRTTLALPYTATEDGIVTAYVNPNSSSASYAFFTIGASDESSTEKIRHGLRTVPINGTSVTNSSPIRKGETIDLHSSLNVKDQFVYFIPINN